MKRELKLVSILFAASLGFAWWASLPETARNPERKAVLSVTPAQVNGIELSSADLKIQIRKVDGPDRWWIETEKAAVKDSFLASNKMKEVLAQLNPLEAIRVLGKVKPEALAEYGLDNSTKKLIVRDSKGAELVSLAVGKQAYGSRNLFVMDLRDNNVLLIPGDVVGDVEKAEIKLYERTITNVVFEEIQKASVSHGGKTRNLAHTRRDDKGSLVWTAENAEGAAVAPAKSWFERLERVRIVAFAKPEELSVLEKMPPLFSVTLDASGASADVLTFAKTKAAGATNDGVMDYWAHSKFLGTWAKVGSSRVEPIEKDLPTLFAN